MRFGDLVDKIRSLWDRPARTQNPPQDRPDKGRRLVLSMLASAPAAAAAPTAIATGGDILSVAGDMVPSVVAKLAPSIGISFEMLENIHRQISPLTGASPILSRQDLDSAFIALRNGWAHHQEGLAAIDLLTGRRSNSRGQTETAAPDFNDLTSAHMAEAFKLAGHAAPPTESRLADMSSCAQSLAKCGFRNATEFNAYLETQRAAHILHLANTEALWPSAIREKTYLLHRLVELLPRGEVKDKIQAAARAALQETIKANNAATTIADASKTSSHIHVPKRDVAPDPCPKVSVWEISKTEVRFGVQSSPDVKITRASLFHLCQKLALGKVRTQSERIRALTAVRPGLTWIEEADAATIGADNFTIVATRDPALIAYFSNLAKPSAQPESRPQPLSSMMEEKTRAVQPVFN